MFLSSALTCVCWFCHSYKKLLCSNSARLPVNIKLGSWGNGVKKRPSGQDIFSKSTSDGSPLHLLRQFTVLIDVSYLLAAEVSGGLCAGAAVNRSFRIASVVVAVARCGLALIHGVVLGRPLQRREALCSPAEKRANTEISDEVEARW